MSETNQLLDDLPQKALPPWVTLLGLGYKKGSGKNAVATMITNAATYYDRVVEIALADTLKEVCKVLFGFTHEQVYTQKGKETDDPYWKKTPRQLLQWVGTDCLRNNLHPDIWVMCLGKSIERFLSACDASQRVLVIVTDVRFINEVEAIHNWGGKVWHINRPSVNQAQLEAAEAGNPPHRSETELDGFDGFDAVIDNSGTLKDLEINVKANFVLLDD
jgi:hypothetical protein